MCCGGNGGFGSLVSSGDRPLPGGGISLAAFWPCFRSEDCRNPTQSSRRAFGKAVIQRLNSPALRGFMRKVRWNDGLGLGAARYLNGVVPICSLETV